jgi:hypothetical protein
MWPTGVADVQLLNITFHVSAQKNLYIYKTLSKHYIHQLLFDNLTKNNHRTAITLLVSIYFEEHHFMNHFHKTFNAQ